MGTAAKSLQAGLTYHPAATQAELWEGMDFILSLSPPPERRRKAAAGRVQELSVPEGPQMARSLPKAPLLEEEMVPGVRGVISALPGAVC